MLAHKGFEAKDWVSAYDDLPNRLLKVKIQDRSVVKTTDAERKATSPEGLQEAVDKVGVSSVWLCREDPVRGWSPRSYRIAARDSPVLVLSS